MSSAGKILTVVIPSYNVEKYLPEIMPYYLDEDVLSDVEILIVNDGSKDKTALIGEEYEKKYPDTIKLINKKNGGHGSTINVGLKEANGKYFKVIDGDDWVDTDGFVKLVRRLKTLDVDLVMNPFVKVNVDAHSREIKGTSNLVPNQIYAFDEIVFGLIDFYQLHSNTYKTELIKNMRKIDENCFYVDQEYILYPIDGIKEMIYLDFPVYQYRVGNADQSMSFINMQKNRKMHEKVVFSLINLLNTENHTTNIDRFIKYKVQKMCQLQIDTLISMKNSNDIKKEVMAFLKNVKKMNSEVYRKIPGKKAKCLRLMGGIGYNFICLSKRNGR